MSNKILVVDDDLNIVKAVTTLLKLHDYQVASAFNGIEGYNVFLEFKPDIVLVDIMMPKLNGHELVLKIRKDNHSFLKKIVYLTAKGMEYDKKEGYAKGADEFIVKPFRNYELLNVIKL